VNARNLTDWDIEDDGFVTIPPCPPLQRQVYDYERMVNRLHEALMRDDFDSIDGMIRDAYLRLHGPND
jgi:uncharacterized C2H2 Zn-finger protein